MTWTSLPTLHDPEAYFSRVPTGFPDIDRLLEGGLHHSAVTLVTSSILAKRIAIHQAIREPGSVLIITLNEHHTPELVAEYLCDAMDGERSSYQDAQDAWRATIDACKFKAIQLDSYSDAHIAIKESAWHTTRPRLILIDDPFDPIPSLRASSSLDLNMGATSTTSAILWSRRGPEDPNDEGAYDFFRGSPLGWIANTIILGDNFEQERVFVSPKERDDFIEASLTTELPGNETGDDQHL